MYRKFSKVKAPTPLVSALLFRWRWEASRRGLCPPGEAGLPSPGWPRGRNLRRIALHPRREQQLRPPRGRATMYSAGTGPVAGSSSQPSSSPTPAALPSSTQPPFPRPPQSREFPKHPKACVSCLGEEASANKRVAEGLGKPQCCGASNLRACSCLLVSRPLATLSSPLWASCPAAQPASPALQARCARCSRCCCWRLPGPLSAVRAHSTRDAGQSGAPQPQRPPLRPGRGEVSRAGLAGEELPQQPALFRCLSFSPAGPVAAAVRELRCMCLTVTPGIHPKMISSLQVFAVGPQCSKVEVV